MIDFNEKAKEIFEQNKAVGWWDDMERCIFQTLQLVNTEISEATEGLRKDLMDDHLPHRKMEEVELADAIIRILDLSGRCNWSLGINDVAMDEADAALKRMSISDAGIHLFFSVVVGEVADCIDYENQYDCVGCRYCSSRAGALICLIMYYCKSKGYDVLTAMDEKLEYNKRRLDHKRENRSEVGGKSF